MNKLVTAVLAGMLLIAGCRTMNVYNVEEAQFISAGRLSLEEISWAIKKAGLRRGWQMVEKEPGHLVARNLVRSHVAVVDIHFDKETYSITYADSENLKYDGTRIHRNYNHWIRNLEFDIQNAVAALADGGRGYPGPPRNAGFASGFVIAKSGQILTNYHVIDKCREALVGPYTLRVLAQDAVNDLALLQGPKHEGPIATFREGRPLEPPEKILVVGYPLHGIVSTQATVTTGSVSALAGPGDNYGQIQITAAVQKGNSGGPVLDTSGNVVGVVVAKLSPVYTWSQVKDLPENTNFAINTTVVRALLDTKKMPYLTAPSNKRLEDVDIAKKAMQFTVLIECRV